MSTSIGTPYKRFIPDSGYDAIVIGSGIGGLAAASLLSQRAGKKVLVLERHYTAGGFTHVFHRPNWEWDVGVHYVGECAPGRQTRALFDAVTAGGVSWQRMPDNYDRIIIADRAYDFISGRERFADRLAEYFPSERAAIGRYLLETRQAAAANTLYEAAKMVPPPIDALAGPFLRRRFLRYASQTTAEALARITRNRELAAVLTGQWGDYGLPPGQSSFAIHAMIVEHYLDGAFYPTGGASAFAAAIQPIIARTGGAVVVSAEVVRVLLDSRQRATGVRMADGRELRAPIVISDAGAWNTYSRLLPESAPGRATALAEIESIPPSMSHICLYVGLRRDPSEPEFGNTNLWIYPSPDHDTNLVNALRDPSQPFPGVFISFPSAKDSTFAARYPGRATIEVVTAAPYAWFERWQGTRWKQRGAEYDTFKEHLAARLRAVLETHVPAVRGKIEYCELSTPLSNTHFSNHRSGEIYGLSATPARFRVRAARVRTPVANLYLTGADAALLGVTGAMAGGALTASAILRRNLVTP